MSMMGRSYYGSRPLKDIPNQEGFKFVGVLQGGATIECVVVKDRTTGCYSVKEFDRLVGWFPKV